MLAILLSFLLCATGSMINCGTGAKFTINTLSQSPDSYIKGGENLTLTLFYTSYEVIETGTITTSITYNFIPIAPTVAPLCESVLCPLQPGMHDGSVSNIFPTGLSGTVVTKIVWKSDVNELLCIQSTLKVS